MGRFDRYSAVTEHESEAPSWPLALGWAIGFFTTLPAGPPQNRTPHGRDVFSFVFVGVVLGVIWSVIALGMLVIPNIALATLVIGALLMTADMLTTGGMHADGLADVADGLAAYRSGADIQRAMEDSALGAVGGGYLVVTYLVRFAFICAALLALAPHGYMVTLIGLAPLVARGIAGMCLKVVAPSKGGLSDPLRSVISVTGASAMIGVVFVIAVIAALATSFPVWLMLIIIGGSIAGALALVYRVSRIFNGIGGGDTCGTGMNISEALVALGFGLSTLVIG